jgi:hypothetical protein
MTHHVFLCQRCANADQHRRCNVKKSTAAFTPSETRILSYMTTNYIPPAGAKAERRSLKPIGSLPSILTRPPEAGIERSSSAFVAPHTARRWSDLADPPVGPPIVLDAREEWPAPVAEAADTLN